MAFSATDAALEGFKITRAKPVAVLTWSAVQLVLVVLSQAALRWLIGPQADAFATLNPLSPLPQAELMKLMSVAFAFLGVNLVLSVVAYGFLYTAVDRAVMRPHEGGWGWLGIGADELRQMAVLFCYALVLLAVYLGGAMVLSILAQALSMGLALGLGLPVVLALVVWIGVRLSLAPPATFERGRFVLFDTWGLTRGRFWPLLGAYIISWLLSILVTILVLAFIGHAVSSVMPGPSDTAASLSLQSMATPKGVVELIFAAIAGGLTTPLTLAPAAYAYREIAGVEGRAAAFN